jgi:hypothetical protein
LGFLKQADKQPRLLLGGERSLYSWCGYHGFYQGWVYYGYGCRLFYGENQFGSLLLTVMGSYSNVNDICLSVNTAINAYIEKSISYYQHPYYIWDTIDFQLVV